VIYDTWNFDVNIFTLKCFQLVRLFTAFLR